MDSIEELNKALTHKLAAEVELRAHEWLVAAKGADWTALFEKQCRQLARYREALEWMRGPHTSENGEDYTDLEFEMVDRAEKALAEGDKP